MDHSESQIIDAVRAGDVDRYGELVRRHEDQILGILMRLVGERQLAEDLAQSAFIRAYEALDRFRGESSFATWLTQIAIHLARANYRRQKGAEIVSLDELMERQNDLVMPVGSGTVSDPFEILAASELEERLESAIGELSDDYREAFVLRHVEDMPYEQISAITGSSVGALKVRTHRARKILLERLAEQEARTNPGRRSV